MKYVGLEVSPCFDRVTLEVLVARPVILRGADGENHNDVCALLLLYGDKFYAERKAVKTPYRLIDRNCPRGGFVKDGQLPRLFYSLYPRGRHLAAPFIY